MEKLPTDIMLDILSRLPYQTIINCKLVCKPWRDVSSKIKVGLLFQFGNPTFKHCFGGDQYDEIDMNGHYSYEKLVEINNHRSIDLEEPLSEMVGSCNGLVCFTVIIGKFTFACDPIYICNPITKEYVYLPKYDEDEPYNDKKAGFFNCGFGYHHSTDEYKVVRIHRKLSNPDKNSGQVQVYTLGSGHGWRDIGTIDHRLRFYPGVCANGIIYWIEWWKNGIVAFHLAVEEFQLIPLPQIFPYGLDRVSLTLLGWHLYVIRIDRGEVEDFIHIWALEKKKEFSRYDMEGHQLNGLWSWRKRFSIPCIKGKTYMPFAVTKSNGF